jgi:hypothetical protein
MWIKKSDFDIKEVEAKQERKRRSLLRPALYGALWSTFLMTLHYLGFRGGTRGVYMFAQPGHFNISTVIIGILCFLIATGMVYRKQLRGEKFFDGGGGETLLCNGCWQPSSLTPGNVCDCGGGLESYDHYRWQEDERQTSLA